MARTNQIIQKGKKSHKILLALSLIGLILYLLDIVFNFSIYSWPTLYDTSKDIQIFALCTLAFTLCEYKYLHIKIILFLLSIWRFIVLFANLTLSHHPPKLLITILALIYVTWLIRVIMVRQVKDKAPEDNEAYHILTPINSMWGFLKALDPRYPALYETAMITDNTHIWMVYRGTFHKTTFEHYELNEINCVRLPLGRQLNMKEYAILKSMVGQKAIRGFKDCRKFLKIK